jgi:3-deoxy-D-manno-octulosonic-acid transferase
MYFVYSLLLTLGFLLLVPRFLLDAFRHGKYVAGFRERTGSVSGVSSSDGPVIWVHCVSVGETQAARPLVEAISKSFPDHQIVVSTITLTGQTLARDVFKAKAARVFYFPFDWRWTVRRSLDGIKPVAVLLMETELWPGFLRECRERRIPVALVNGRLSEKSFGRYKMIGGFVARVLRCVDLALMQTESDAARIRELKIDPRKVLVSGSLKFDAGAMPPSVAAADTFRERYNLGASPLILAASTHAPEEKIVLETFQSLRAGLDGNVRLMIAPRHPERFNEVASLINSSRLSVTRQSAAPSLGDATCDVILLDTIGDLPSVYPLASLVFVGGSIAKTGGHNILEPAAAGRAIVTGAHTDNFRDIVRTFAAAGAIVQLPDLSDAEAANELARVFAEMLEDPKRRADLGDKAKQLVEQNRGASERTVKLIKSLLINQSAAEPSAVQPLEGVHPA